MNSGVENARAEFTRRISRLARIHFCRMKRDISTNLTEKRGEKWGGKKRRKLAHQNSIPAKYFKIKSRAYSLAHTHARVHTYEYSALDRTIASDENCRTQQLVVTREFFFSAQTSSGRVEQHGGRVRQQRRHAKARRHVGPVRASGLFREDAGSTGESRGTVVPLQQGEGPLSDRVQVRRRRGQIHRDLGERSGDCRRERAGRRQIRLLARRRSSVLVQHHRGRAQMFGARQVQRLPEDLFGLVSRVREVQVGDEELGEEASGKSIYRSSARVLLYLNPFIYSRESPVILLGVSRARARPVLSPTTNEIMSSSSSRCCRRRAHDTYLSLIYISCPASFVSALLTIYRQIGGIR